MNKLDKLAKALVESQERTADTSPYDTTATVTRIEGDTAWVHIPGGVDETPVKLTISAGKGDTVQVRVSGGTAYIIGNSSRPPTDDRIANVAKAKADTAQATADDAVKSASVATTKAVFAQETADGAQETAQDAHKIAADTAQYFWVTETGTDTGAHITEVSQEAFQNNPSGGNLLARSNGIAVRDGLTELARFGDTVQIGADDDSHIIIGNASIEGRNSDDLPYFQMLDEQGQTGSYTLTGDGTTKTFTVFANASVETITSVTINGVATTAYTASAAITGWYGITFNTAPANGATIVVSTEVTSFAPSFAFGGSFGTLEPFSLVAGELCSTDDTHCVAMGNSSSANGVASLAAGNDAHATGRRLIGATGTAIALGDHVRKSGPGCALGQYNDYTSAGLGNNLLEIGNGTSDSNRKNALTVDESGKLTVQNHSSPIGTVKSATKAVKISTADIATTVDGPSVSLEAGVWIITGTWTFNTGSSTGARNLQVLLGTASSTLNSTRVMAGQSVYARLNCMYIFEATTTTTVYVKGSSSITDSGNAPTQTIRAVRIV